jgi:hypothetical protein
MTGEDSSELPADWMRLERPALDLDANIAQPL